MHGVPNYFPDIKLSDLEQERREIRLNTGLGSEADLAESLPKRREEIITGGHSIATLKRRFPYLFTEEGVSAFVFLLFMQLATVSL